MAEGYSSTEPLNLQMFVERRDVMEWLKEKYNTKQNRRGSQDHQYRIYGVHGKKRVGKSFLMQTFLQQIQQNVSRNQKVHVGTFDFDKIKTFKSFLNSLCKFYGVEMHKWRKSSNHSDNDDEEEEDFTECMLHIENKMKAEPSNKFIVFLDNMENACGKARNDGTAPDRFKKFLWDKIYREFIHNLLPRSNNLLVFITSTQTAKFAEFGKISCNTDMKEMDEKEAKCLLQNEILGTETDDECLSAIVRLCDGLPPTIIKAGAMLRDGEYTYEEIAALLNVFDNKMSIHSDDLYPIDDHYDAQLMKYINRLSSDNRKNLGSLAKMIKQKQGEVSMAEAAEGLKFEANTAVFKLKFLLPLRFRGMVEVDKKTGIISMNSFFHQFVLEYIKGEKNVEGTTPVHSSTNGTEVSPPLTNHSDDDDDFDAESPTANHLIVPSHNSRDKASRLLDDTDITDEAVTQRPTVRDVTVISHHTQDSSSRLLSEEKSDAQTFGEEKLEPNTAKMEGHYIGNRDQKSHYDITLSNLDLMQSGNKSMENNYLSPDNTRNSTHPWNITRCNTVQNKSIPADVKSESSDNVKMLETDESYKKDVTIGKKRSDTLDENTMITCKYQSGKGMESLMSFEDNSLQPNRVSVSSHRSILRKKINQEGSFDDNSLQDRDPELGKFTKTVFSIDTANNSSPDHTKCGNLDCFDGVHLQSQRSASTTTDMTEDNNCSETNEKLVYSNTSGTACFSQDFQPPVTGESRYEDLSQYNAMSYLGSADCHTQDPLVEDPDDLNNSFASDKLFASGKFRSSAFHEIIRNKTQSFDQCLPQALIPQHKGPERECKPSEIRPSNTDPTTRSTVTPGQGDGTSHNTSQIHLSQMGAQELSPLEREIGTVPLKDTRTGPSVQSDTQSNTNSSVGSESSPYITGQVEPAVLQERTGVFTYFTQFFSNTFQVLKEMES